MATPSSSKAIDFQEAVLTLEPRVAVFDCDGTLWSGDSGEGFFRWELERNVVDPDIARWAVARYADYKAGKVDEEVMCGEMVTIHAGLQEDDLKKLAKEFFEENFFAQIFPEMRTLVSELLDEGCDVWAVSSTNEWVIEAAMENFGLPKEKILAASVELDAGVITDRIIRVPSGPGKSQAIREVIGKTPDAVFGNSKWDADMMEQGRHAFAVNPNPDLEAQARKLGWTIYWPDGVAHP
jgi:HAD superfamily phosphoserine phosphatase-like hydrolase